MAFNHQQANHECSSITINDCCLRKALCFQYLSGLNVSLVLKWTSYIVSITKNTGKMVGFLSLLLYRYFHGKFSDELHPLVQPVISFTSKSSHATHVCSETQSFSSNSIGDMKVPNEYLLQKNHFFVEPTHKEMLPLSLQIQPVQDYG